jgi:hypothetical protein
VTDSEFVRNIALTATVVTYADVLILGSSFVQNYGSIRNYVGYELSVVASDFVENKATEYVDDGGAIFSEGPLTVTGSTFIGNEATHGGAIRAGDPRVTDDSYVADCVFEGNTAEGVGGAIMLDGGSLVVEGGWFGGNTAELGGAIGNRDNGSLTVTASELVGNQARLGGAVYLLRLEAWLTNNTWVGNAAMEAGGHLWASRVTGASTNEVYAYAPSGGGLYFDGAGKSLVATYGVWHGNVPVDLTQTSASDVTGSVAVFEPGFAVWSDDGDFTNDDLTPAAGSPLIDAGDPALWDVDGSRSDIGATGGPYFGLPDQDGDGFAASEGDCNDADPAVSPDAGTDDPSDAIDTDCDGFDERDQDGDGFEGAANGGPDCDDADATIKPGSREVCDGVDEDCDGAVDDGPADGSDWFADADGDGFTDPAARAWACDAPAGFYAASVPPDCDDTDADVFPGADDPSEDGVDQDCDGRDTPAAADTKRVLAPAETGCAHAPPGAPLWAVAALLAARRRVRGPAPPR